MWHFCLVLASGVAWSGALSNDRKMRGLHYLSLFYGRQGDHEPGKEPGDIIFLFLCLIILFLSLIILSLSLLILFLYLMILFLSLTILFLSLIIIFLSPTILFLSLKILFVSLIILFLFLIIISSLFNNPFPLSYNPSLCVALLPGISERVAWSGAISNDRKTRGLLYLSLFYGCRVTTSRGRSRVTLKSSSSLL